MSRNYTRYIVTCITLLGLVCLVGGTTLIFKGYPGDLVIGGGLAAISGLIGMLSNRTTAGPALDEQTPAVTKTSSN